MPGTIGTQRPNSCSSAKNFMVGCNDRYSLLCAADRRGGMVPPATLKAVRRLFSDRYSMIAQDASGCLVPANSARLGPAAKLTCLPLGGSGNGATPYLSPA